MQSDGVSEELYLLPTLSVAHEGVGCHLHEALDVDWRAACCDLEARCSVGGCLVHGTDPRHRIGGLVEQDRAPKRDQSLLIQRAFVKNFRLETSPGRRPVIQILCNVLGAVVELERHLPVSVDFVGVVANTSAKFAVAAHDEREKDVRGEAVHSEVGA